LRHALRKVSPLQLTLDDFSKYESISQQTFIYGRDMDKQRFEEMIRNTRQKFEEEAAEAIRDSPSKTYDEVAATLLVSRGTVIRIAKKFGLTRPRGAKSPAYAAARERR